MSTYQTGRNGELEASQYLESHGYKVLERNWRTRYCEIDIVAIKKQIIFFAEVKYRQSVTWGKGLDYITQQKLQNMQFAAEMWVHNHGWKGDYQLLAVGLDSQGLEIVAIDV